MTFTEYREHDGTGLADLIRSKQVSAAEVLEACIKAIEDRNGEINAVVLKLYEQARQTGVSEGQFGGVPFLLKDLGQYLAGVPTSSGSRLFNGTVKAENSTLVTRYQRAGLVICGKTNTPELGLATTTEPVLFGPTRNPVNPAHSAGGSSGGAAAAVASGMVPMAHASDGGGSIRIPSSCCGLVGLKPTRGRVPLGPFGLEGWGGLSTAHAITRTVRDSAALLDLTAGEEPGAPYFAPPRSRSFSAMAQRDPEPLNIAVTSQSFAGLPVDAEVKRTLDVAGRVCTDLGHRVDEDRPRIDEQVFKDGHGIIALSHVSAAIEERLGALGRSLTREDVEAVTMRNYEAGKALTGAQYAWAQNRIREESLEMARFFDNYDLLMTPTMGILPPRIGDLDMMSDDDETYLNILYGMIGFTALFNDTGLPAISVPLGRSASGLPVGIQFVAPMGGEGLLLSIAGQLERAGHFV